MQFESFSPEIAFEIGSRIRNYFTGDELGGGIAITITLFSGVTLFACSIGKGVTPDNFEWAKRKTNTVKRFGISSWLRGQTRTSQGKPADDPLLGSDFAAHGGAFPINIKGVSTGPIGAIAVSGLTQALDHTLIIHAVGTVISDGKLSTFPGVAPDDPRRH